MPNAYISGILGKLNAASHLSQVTTVSQTDLQTQVTKFNYVAEEAIHKSQKDALVSSINGAGVRNTDQLVRKIEEDPNYLVQLTDNAWLLLAERVTPGQIKPYTEMVDPSSAVKNGSMLSHTKRGFRELGVCFRGDNRAFSEFGPEGFIARYAVPRGNRFHIPETFGTVIARGMFFDRQNRDFLNQTGVCVSRNIVGSMKFISSRSGGAWLYAVQFRVGADTEAYQLQKGGTALWRPGEKAAWEVPKMDFLAAIQVETSLKDDNAISKDMTATWFQYRILSDWQFFGTVDSSRRAYIEKSTADKPKNVWLDFSRADDFALPGSEV